jgi:hypothetical protein
MIIDNTKLTQSKANWIRTKPQGIVVQDSYNNISFPISDIRVDSNKQNIEILTDKFVSLYSGDREQNILPWHYIIEFLNEGYTVYNTRPLNLKYIRTIQETLEDSKNKKILNEQTHQLINSSTDITQMIHILIMGDSNSDIYTKKLYKTIAEYIIIPTARVGGFAPTVDANIFYMNLGSSFKFNLIRTYLHV